MKTEIKLSIKELEEIIMSAWVNGWQSKSNLTDYDKRVYSEIAITKIIHEE
jgi:hypothetical protein